jgi:transmembrane sensor
MTARDTSALIDDQAADWVARQDAAELTDAEIAKLDAWLEADPRHLGAYARARAVVTHFDRARALGAQRQIWRGRPKQSVWKGAAITTTAAFMTLMIAITVGTTINLRQPRQESLATAIGEIRRNPLEDGSAITLNTGSAVKASFTEDTRTIVLVEGEAMFDVAADKARPFRVQAGDVTVTAVGTSFTVRLRQDTTVEVVVREGVVEVVRNGAEAVRISANDVLRWEPKGPPDAKRQGSDDIDRAIAWRNGMINLDGMTLAEAASEFARYGGKSIRIPQRDVAAMKVTGLFSASDPEGFARAAALSLGIEVQPEGNSITILDEGL